MLNTPDEMLVEVLEAARALEGHSRHPYRVYVESKRSGGTIALDVEVKIAPESAAATRYRVTVTPEGGVPVSGNPAPTLHEALYILRIRDFGLEASQLTPP
jgi:hypothetical protein